MPTPFPGSAVEQVLAVIPARYGSTRFPGKPLVEIQGKPMIQHVWERASEVPGIRRTIVATDDARIQTVVTVFGGEVRMTSPDHPSGTDRVWEVAEALPEYSLILNLQGDEPFLEAGVLDRLLAASRDWPQADIMTLVTPFDNPADVDNPNMVKAVLAQDGRALYFSRAAVPFHRDTDSKRLPYYRHLGLYLYRRPALARFVGLPPSPLEQAEKLEQLRALEAGMTLYAMVVDRAPVGIDTPEDLLRLESA